METSTSIGYEAWVGLGCGLEGNIKAMGFGKWVCGFGFVILNAACHLFFVMMCL